MHSGSLERESWFMNKCLFFFSQLYREVKYRIVSWVVNQVNGLHPLHTLGNQSILVSDHVCWIFFVNFLMPVVPKESQRTGGFPLNSHQVEPPQIWLDFCCPGVIFVNTCRLPPESSRSNPASATFGCQIELLSA